MTCCIALVFVLTACGNDVSSPRMGGPGSATLAAATEVPKNPAADALRAIAPPEGIKYTKLFNDPLSGDMRLTRIENAIQQLRDEMDTALPSIVRLAAVESDMRDLITELDSLTNGPAVIADPSVPVDAMDLDMMTESQPAANAASTPAPVAPIETQAPPSTAAPSSVSSDSVALDAALADIPQTAPPAAPANTPVNRPENTNVATPVDLAVPPSQGTAQTLNGGGMPVTSQTAIAPATAVVKNVKILDMQDKTLAGLIMSAPAPYSVRVEDEGFRVVVDVQGARKGDVPASISASPKLITAHQVEETATGVRVTFDTSLPVKILKDAIIASVNGSSHILQIDLQPAE